MMKKEISLKLLFGSISLAVFLLLFSLPTTSSSSDIEQEVEATQSSTEQSSTAIPAVSQDAPSVVSEEEQAINILDTTLEEEDAENTEGEEHSFEI
jgi:hypothetical protein